MSTTVRSLPIETATAGSLGNHSGNGTTRPSHAAASASKPFNWRRFWRLFFAVAKKVIWDATMLSIIVFVYLAVISQGFRYVLPDLGMRLYKMPGLAFLQDYTATYRLDLAHLFAAVPLISSCVLWHLLLEIYLWPTAFAERFQRWDLDRLKRAIVTMGVIVITGDACLFAAAFTLSGWGGSKFSAVAVLATLVYVTLLAFVTFISLYLAESIDNLKKKEN